MSQVSALPVGSKKRSRTESISEDAGVEDAMGDRARRIDPTNKIANVPTNRIATKRARLAVETAPSLSRVEQFLARLNANAEKTGVPATLRQAFYKVDLTHIYTFAIDFVKTNAERLMRLQSGEGIRFDKSEFNLPRSMQITLSEKGKLHLFVETNRKSKTGNKDLNDAFIGAGTYKSVLRCYRLDSKSTKAWACAKIKEDIEDAVKEAALANQLNHPHIFHCEIGRPYKNGNKIALYSKLAIGTLEDINSGKIPATEIEKKTLVMQVFDAVAYLHANNIVHQDIKPENVLIFRDNQGNLVAKLNDFGLSVRSDQIVPQNPKSTFGYESPQIIAFYRDKNSELHDYYFDGKQSTLAKSVYRKYARTIERPNNVCKSNDCWALGVLYYEVLHGKKPNLRIITSKQKSGNHVIDGLLCIRAQQRLTCEGALKLMQPEGQAHSSQLRK